MPIAQVDPPVTSRNRVSSNTQVDEYADAVAHAIGATPRQPMLRALERTPHPAPLSYGQCRTTNLR